MLHSCFFIPDASGWVDERIRPETTIWRKMRHYYEPFAGRVYWRRADGQFDTTPHYHRPLSWYFRALSAAGLTLASFVEPKPPEEFVTEVGFEGQAMLDVPQHCLIEARKLSSGTEQAKLLTFC